MAEKIKDGEVPTKTITTLEIVSAVIIVLTIAGSLIFAYLKNTISFSNNTLMAFFWLTLMVTAYPTSEILRIRERDAFRAAGSLLIILFVAGGISICLWSAVFAVLGIYSYATTSVNVPLITSIAIVAGAVLWKLRVVARACYGFIEVGAGVGLTMFNAQNNVASTDGPSPQLYSAILTGGIFLIVRGLDNMDQGLNTKNGKFFDTWIQASLSYVYSYIEKRNMRDLASKQVEDEAAKSMPPRSQQEVLGEAKKQEAREKERLDQIALTDEIVEAAFPRNAPIKPTAVFENEFNDLKDATGRNTEARKKASEATGRAVMGNNTVKGSGLGDAIGAVSSSASATDIAFRGVTRFANPDSHYPSGHNINSAKAAANPMTGAPAHLGINSATAAVRQMEEINATQRANEAAIAKLMNPEIKSVETTPETLNERIARMVGKDYFEPESAAEMIRRQTESPSEQLSRLAGATGNPILKHIQEHGIDHASSNDANKRLKDLLRNPNEGPNTPGKR